MFRGREGGPLVVATSKATSARRPKPPIQRTHATPSNRRRRPATAAEGYLFQEGTKGGVVAGGQEDHVRCNLALRPVRLGEHHTARREPHHVLVNLMHDGVQREGGGGGAKGDVVQRAHGAGVCGRRTSQGSPTRSTQIRPSMVPPPLSPRPPPRVPVAAASPRAQTHTHTHPPTHTQHTHSTHRAHTQHTHRTHT